MKLTKSKLKQLIKEAYEEVEAPSDREGPEEKAKAAINQLMKDARELYASLPDEGKRTLTQNFEMYFNKWEQELEDKSEEEWEQELEGKSEEELASSFATASPVAAAASLFHSRM